MATTATVPAGRRRRLRFLPVVERELRIASRGKAAFRWRTSTVATALGLMAMVTFYLSVESAPAEWHGRALFHSLVGVSGLFAFLASVSVTADTVSREKREGTLGLLFLTDLRGMDIILGKLAANSLNTVYSLLGLLPLLAIPVLLGGVNIETGVLATLAVVNLLFVSLCLGIFVSTLSWDERRATFAAVIGGLVLMVGPFVAGGLWVWMLGRGPVLTVLLSALSPLFPLMSVLPNATGVRAWPPVWEIVPSHLLGWVLLRWAGWLVQRAWHSRSGSPVRRTVDERVFTPRDPAERSRHRRQLLDVHPLVWLLERHPGKRYYADGLVASIVVIWAWGYRTYGTDMFGGPVWFLIVPLAFTVHLILASWVVAESSMRLLEDRRSGALELLLCTSLTDAEIIRGHRLAMRRLFLRPVVFLALAEVFVAFTAFGTEGDETSVHGRWMMLAMAAAVALDTHALSWFSLRLALALPTVNRVGVFALAITPFGPVLLTALAAIGLSILSGGGRVPFVGVLGIWLGMVLLVDLVGGQWWCRRAVLREFREVAARVQPRAATAG